MGEKMATCPMCAEDVEASAERCPHCGSALVANVPKLAAPASAVVAPAGAAGARGATAKQPWGVRQVLMVVGLVWVSAVAILVIGKAVVERSAEGAQLAEAERRRAESKQGVADAHVLAESHDWAGAYGTLNSAAAYVPLDDVDASFRHSVALHLALETMCAGDVEGYLRLAPDLPSPTTTDGLSDAERRHLQLLDSMKDQLAVITKAQADVDDLERAAQNLEGGAAATLCGEAQSVTNAFDFDPSKLSAMERAALQRCASIGRDTAGATARAAAAGRRYAGLLAELNGTFRRRCADGPPQPSPPVPPPIEPARLPVEEGDIEGVVEKIETGDYEHLVLRTVGGIESYILAADLGDDVRATLVGKAVRVHYATKKMQMPEAGAESEELVATSVVLAALDAPPDGGTGPASPPDAGVEGDAAPPREEPPVPEVIVPPAIDWITSNGLTVAKVETTAGQYRTCIRARVCDDNVRLPLTLTWKEADEPRAISGVTKEQASAFCQWVDGRLLTSAEWTRVASNGGKTEFPWPASRGNDPPECGSTNGPFRGCQCNGDRNVDGVCDLAGNVHEWVQDGVCGGFYFSRGAQLRADNCSRGEASNPGFRCAKGTQ